jgi:hypothetical protein
MNLLIERARALPRGVSTRAMNASNSAIEAYCPSEEAGFSVRVKLGSQGSVGVPTTGTRLIVVAAERTTVKLHR